MAEETTKDAGATFYNVRTLNKWFFVSAAALTFAYILSVTKDHFREWKGYQRDFMEMERELAVRQGASAFAASGGKDATEHAEAEIERLRGILLSNREERPKLESAVREAQLRFNQVNAEMKAKKANYEADRFHYEEFAYERSGALKESGGAYQGDPFQVANIRDDVLRARFDEFNELKLKYLEADDANKAAEDTLNKAKAALARFDALADDVQKDLDGKQRETNRLIKRADSVDMERPFNIFRNGIFVNFLAPSVTPRKIVVNEIFDDLNFLKVPKVDMCTTCHLATDRSKDYPPGNSHVTFDAEKDQTGVNPEFRSHSKPELFCTSLSPHGQERFGCSGCHGGGNQRLEFASTFHTPSNEEEREKWHEELGWHPVHEWDFPMISSEFIDSSCYKCHKTQLHINGADQWNKGRDLVAKFGCFGCHKMAPFDGTRRVGPPLGHLTSKLQSLDWTLKWVDNPTSFRPTTRMPAFFHLENRSTEGDRGAAEVTALATFLYSVNTPQPLDTYPGNGDADRGRKIFGGDFGGRGCLACHNIDEFKKAEVGDLRHGPDLSGIGSKVTADWLYTWVRDPKRLWPDTNMPNLRLTDQEGADVVAYLMTKKNETFDHASFTKPEGDILYEQILAEKLTERMTEDQAVEAIHSMSSFEKRRKAGEFLLNHYGCFGCHDIPGYEDAKPIGTELNGWGSKHADRLDFGVFEMDWKDEGKFNRETWLTQKLSNTRFYDRGKDKRPFEKLKMPQFALLKEGMPPEDRDAVMTFVLSLVKDNTAASIQRTLTPAEQSVERGKRLVREKNCYGCHIIFGEGGEIRKFQGEEGVAYYPPILDGQGARTQPDWLDRFLADPVMGGGRGAKAYLRPWMKARMPTFEFTQQQLNDIVAYFAHEEVWHTADDRKLWDSVVAKFRGDFPGYDEKAMRTAPAGKQQLYQSLIARTYRRLGGHFTYENDFPYQSMPAPLDAADLARARKLFEANKCVECHLPGGKVPKGKGEGDLAPNLMLAKARLAPKWVIHWFEGPGAYQPGTRMPNFWSIENGVRASLDDTIGDADKEMRLLRDYLFSKEFDNDYLNLAAKVPVNEN